jgi:hypothetical protein
MKSETPTPRGSAPNQWSLLEVDLMRFLYVGHLWNGSTTLERMQVLRALGHDIIPFDLQPYEKAASRVERSVMARLHIGPAITRMNRDLAVAAKASTYDAVWVDKGVWVYPETVAEIRGTARQQFAIHFTPDAQLLDNRSRHFGKSIPNYDLMVTTKPFEVEAYRHAGARDTLLILQGYGEKFNMIEEAGGMAPSTLVSSLCFIGHSQSHYRHQILSLVGRVENLKVWGPRWPRHARLRSSLKPVVQGEGLWGETYPQALRASKIALGLLSKRIPETTTTRTFEIPATGTFMLAERTDDHLALFEEGKEAEFFTGVDELRDKAQFYLSNDEARNKIAAAGRERCWKSGYSQKRQIERILNHIEGGGGHA